LMVALIIFIPCRSMISNLAMAARLLQESGAQNQPVVGCLDLKNYLNYAGQF
jgi:hypothetical protein